MPYNFDEIVDRSKSHSIKWDARKHLFGTEDVLPMWVADMDFKTPDFIIEAVRERLDHELLGYTLRHDEYFESIMDWMQKRHEWNVKKNWILYTPGVVPALNMAVQSYTQPGDKVILQPPVYHPFYMAIEDHGRHVVRNPLKEKEGRYFFDFDDLKKKIDKRTKLLLLSHPHNPGGRVWTQEELEELGEICHRNGVIIISDEIHSDLIFKPHKHIPLAKVSEKLADITVTCMAPSKTFNLAGLSTSSVIISNKRLREQFETTLNSWHVFMGNIPGFVASVAAYRKGEQWLEELLSYLKGNYKYVCDFVAEHIPKIKIMPLEATYLLWIDFRAFELTHKELEKKIVKEAKLGFNTGDMFGKEGEGYMRMNLAHPRAQVEQAMIGLKDAFGKE